MIYLKKLLLRNVWTNLCNINRSVNTHVIEDAGVRRITLCNKGTRNALSYEMLNEICVSVTKDIANPSLRSIVISAEGRVFSCGHDLNELKKEKGTVYHQKIFSKCTELMSAILECPVPVIAAVNGIATAAGCQLVAACDIAICTESSKFALPGANVGIFCSTPSVPVSRRIPKNLAMYMLLTANAISAEQAAQSGLVLKTVPDNSLAQELKLITDAIGDKSRSVIELGKRLFYAQLEMDVKTAYKHAEDIMVHNIGLKDAQEGICGFLEKRKPQWTHSFDI